VLGSIEFVERHPMATSLIPYDQLFDELKTLLIKLVSCNDQLFDLKTLLI
jgi:hypothetical protein